MSDDNDSEEDFIPKRRSLKNTIASDDENEDGDSAPTFTEDITLHLSDDEDYEESNPPPPPVEEQRQIISSDISENVNKENDSNDILSQTSEHVKSSPVLHLKKSNRVPFHSLIDSDSEPEERSRPDVESSLSTSIVHEDSQGAESPRKTQEKSELTKQKRSTLFDSDSEDVDDPQENFNNIREDSHDAGSPRKKQSKSKPTKQKHRSLWDSDSDEAVEADSSKKRSSLFDSDSDEVDHPQENFAQGQSTKKVSGKPKKSSAGKQKKGSSKDAMLAIRSESQRMTRESTVSLPYHRPKQHSLSDFLNRRRLAPTSMKASVEELVKFQKESEKEIKEFYQSESEHSDDDKENDPDWNEEQEKDEDEKEVGAGEQAKSECEKENANENSNVATGNSEDKNTEMMDEGGTETEAKNDADITTIELNDEETQREGGEETEKKKDDDGMETEDIVLDEKLEDQNEIQSISDVVNEENAEEKRDIVDVASQKETSDEEKPPQVEAVMEDEKDTREIDEKFGDKTEENKKSESCPIDSQDVRLKYSEDLSEALEKPSINFDPISDSDDDDDVQMVKDPPKPREEPKLILKGNPNDVIDLNDDFTTHKGKTEDLEGLKNRFMRHSLSSKPKASPKTVSIKVVDLAPDGSITGIKEETVAWSSEKAPVDHTPPGLKMKMLKKALERQIIEKREKEFEEKESSGAKAAKDDYEDGDDDILDDTEDDDILDDKEDDDGVSAVGGDDEASEDDADDEVDDDVEDEIDEDDEEICERPRKKSAFVDDEASVEDDEEKSVDLDDEEVDKEDEEYEKDESSSDAKKRQFSRTDTNVDMFASQMSDEDDMIPGYQPCGGRRNASPLSLPRSTPSCSETNTNESFRLPEITQGSPNSSFQRLRFGSDFNSQNTDFSTTQILKKYAEGKKEGIMELAQSPEAQETEADLMAMCSGQFTTQPFSLESQGDNPVRTDNSAMVDSQDSQDLQLKWTEDSPTDESKSTAKIGKTRLIIESSDEEDEAETAVKRRTKRLSFSDDESNSVAADDFINDEEEEEQDDLPDPGDVMYDSDENEIPIKSAAAFLENEAELSEDDYVGSGDEDEGEDNDQMEEELGDMDEFDQDKVREELGRIHMRNMLDDDRRDVRLMQEMLLEDGELHDDGKGRQRQFRWKNTDLATLMSSQTTGSDEEKVDEDEDDDGEWRQNRYEREMFLAGILKDKDGKTLKIQVEDEVEDSELMILGKTVMKRQSSSRLEIKEKASKPAQPPAIPDSPMKSFLSRTHSRGSFLSRTSDVLTRLAENAAGKNGIVGAKANNSRNFVFAAISPPKPQENGDDVENEPRSNAKRKAKRSLIAQPEKKSCTSQSSGYTSLFDYL